MPRNQIGGRRQRVLVDRINEQSNVLGRAIVALNEDQARGYLGNDLRISLNAHNLTRFSDAATWGGIILHEILHNVGGTHPGRNSSDYVGSLVYEIGWCVEREGADKSFGLTGNDGIGGAIAE